MSCFVNMMMVVRSALFFALQLRVIKFANNLLILCNKILNHEVLYFRPTPLQWHRSHISLWVKFAVGLPPVSLVYKGKMGETQHFPWGHYRLKSHLGSVSSNDTHNFIISQHHNALAKKCLHLKVVIFLVKVIEVLQFSSFR